MAAGMAGKAAEYLMPAGNRAFLMSDSEEALAKLARGLALVEELPDGPGLVEPELLLWFAYREVLYSVRRFSDPGTDRIYARTRTLLKQMDQLPFPLLNRPLWALHAYQSCRPWGAPAGTGSGATAAQSGPAGE